MSALDAFMWGGAIAGVVMHLLNRSYERIIERRLQIARDTIGILEQRLKGREAEERELLDARVEVAFNFGAMRRAARDEVRT